MSQAPLTFLEKKWANMGNGNGLIAAATQTSDRKNIPLQDYDVHRNVSTLGRRTLLTLGRYLFQNCPPARGAILEIARTVAGTYIPQYLGKLKPEWGEMAENHFKEEDNFINIRGGNNTMATYRRNLLISVIRDGDFGTIMTTDRNGEPKIQCIPAHRIGSRLDPQIVYGGRYDGLRLLDGVIVDQYGGSVAYRVYRESLSGMEYDEVSSDDMFLSFVADYDEQVRGFSLLASSAFDWQDLADSRQFELIAEKINASFAVQIKNETGYADKTKAALQVATLPPDSTGAIQEMPKQVIKPGQIMYFKGGQGQGIETHKNERPSQNVQTFWEETIRSALHSIGWSFDFSHNPSKAGGAQMRIVIEKINASIKEYRDLILFPACRRLYVWRAAKAIKNSHLPPNEEWYKFGFQGAPEITADEKYSSDTALQNVRAGFKSPQKVIEQDGDFWEDVQDDAIAFEKRFQDKCKLAGVDPNRIILLTPNGNSSVTPVDPKQDQPPIPD